MPVGGEDRPRTPARDRAPGRRFATAVAAGTGASARRSPRHENIVSSRTASAAAEAAGSRCRARRGDHDRERDERGDHVARQEVVLAEQPERERARGSRTRRSPPHAGSAPASGGRRRSGSAHATRDGERGGADQSGRDRRAAVEDAHPPLQRGRADAGEAAGPGRSTRFRGWCRRTRTAPSPTCTSATAPTAAQTPVARSARQRHNSHSASGATAKPAKKWVINASAETHGPQSDVAPRGVAPERGRTTGTPAPVSAASNMYARASCENQIRNGLTATNAAAITPAQRDASSRADR